MYQYYEIYCLHGNAQKRSHQKRVPTKQNYNFKNEKMRTSDFDYKNKLSCSRVLVS